MATLSVTAQEILSELAPLLTKARRKPVLSVIDQEIFSVLAPLLTKARRKPVALSRNGKTAAFLVSPRAIEQFAKMMEELEEIEDKYLAIRADEVLEDMKKNPPLSAKQSRKFLDDILNS